MVGLWRPWTTNLFNLMSDPTYKILITSNKITCGLLYPLEWCSLATIPLMFWFGFGRYSLTVSMFQLKKKLHVIIQKKKITIGRWLFHLNPFRTHGMAWLWKWFPFAPWTKQIPNVNHMLTVFIKGYSLFPYS